VGRVFSLGSPNARAYPTFLDHPYIEAIRTDFPQIRAYQEDDFEWRNEGINPLKAFVARVQAMPE
jgi:hypothetical protein